MGNCVSDKGYKEAEKIRFDAVGTATLIKQVVAVAQFALSASDAVSNFKKLWNISSRGVAIEEAQHAHLRDVYWPAEDKFMAEFVQATPWDSQPVLAQRYSGRMWAPLAGAFAKKIKELECSKARYCGKAYKRAMQELLITRGLTKANVITLADKIAFAEVQSVSDRDFERRKAAVSMRKGLIGQAAALMRSAADGYAAAGADALASANNAIQTIGYNFQNRYNPDPGFHQRALNTAGRSQSGGGNMNVMNNAGDLGATTGTEWSVIDVGDSSKTYDSMDGANDHTGNFVRTNWTAATSNDIQGAVQGGEGQDLARGGTAEMRGIFERFRMHYQESDLVDVSAYRTDDLQDGPDSLPGTPSPRVVTYLPNY